MALSLIHRGHTLTREQMDVINPVLVDAMNNGVGKNKLVAAIDKALEAAGCPVPAEETKETK